MIDIANFVKVNGGWELTNSGKFFLGKQVTITVDTQTDSKHPHNEIYKEQIETLNTIDVEWDELVVVIEQEILAYEKISRETLLEILDSPVIWLHMNYDTNQPSANNHWSFVLGVIEGEDFGWHVEFEGIKCTDTWAGG